MELNISETRKMFYFQTNPSGTSKQVLAINCDEKKIDFLFFLPFYRIKLVNKLCDHNLNKIIKR